MNWWIVLLIVAFVIALIASIFGKLANIVDSLEQIIKFSQRLVNPMLKRRWIREQTYPLKITIKEAHKYGLNNPLMTAQILVFILVEPRKKVILGECEMIHYPNPSHFKGRPDNKWMVDERAQEWYVGEELDKARIYILNFIFAPEPINGIQIQIESEGYECKSNLFTIS